MKKASAMHSRSKGPRTSGFTLIEVVFALAIFALGIASTLALTGWLARGTGFGSQTTAAALYAQDKIEELMLVPYTNVAGGNDSINEYARTWTVSNQTARKVIDVRVAWTATGGRNRQLSTRMIVAQP